MSRKRTNKPLTLEQLKQMNGRPVWWWNKSQKPTVTICLVDRFSKEPHFVSYDFVAENSTKISKYSLIRRWGYLPYASDPTVQQPAHIDREKWGMCEVCQLRNCNNCQFINLSSLEQPCSECDGKSKWQPAGNYCWCCGRPLTEEAWAELERRVLGE